jgi:hypothetical protein
VTELKALTEVERLYLRGMLLGRRHEILSRQRRTGLERVELRRIKVLLDKFAELEEVVLPKS